MSAEKQRKTFLSYSRVNKDFAVRLAKELKAEGFDIWLDQLDIPLGARWDVEVEKALEESEIFMIIMTAASISSENVRDEIGYAIDNGKRFLPVLLENCNIPLRLRRFQYVDFTNKSFDEGVESAKELLRGLIAQETLPRGVTAADVQAEAERGVKEEYEAKAEAGRKAKEEANRLSAQKAEEERLAKAKIEADRLAVQKAETEHLAKAKADRKTKEDADRLAAQKMEEERLAKQKAEEELAVKAKADREAKVEEDRKAEAEHLIAKKVVTERQVHSASAKRSMAKPVIIGFFASIVLLAICGAVGIMLSRTMNTQGGVTASNALVDSTATVPVRKPTNTTRPSNTPVPTQTQIPTEIPAPVILSVNEATALIDKGPVKGFYAFAREQFTVEQLAEFREKNQPIPLANTNSIPLLLGYSGCAKTTAILDTNAVKIVYTFEFNGKKILEQNFGSYDFDYEDSDGRTYVCRVTYIIIDKWVTGQYPVYQGVEQKEIINDGYEDYEPYSDSQEYIVTVP